MTFYAFDRVRIRHDAPRAAGLAATVTAGNAMGGDTVHVKPDGWDRSTQLAAYYLRPLHPGNEDRQP